MQDIYAFQPDKLVCDAHPGYRARRWAQEQDLPVETVLHHHAHAAACPAENGWPLDGGDAIALTLDGIGMGENGALWGGECLRVNYLDCERLGGCLPWRCRAAIWRQSSRGVICSPTAAFVPDWQRYPETRAVQRHSWPLLATAIQRGINAPQASSCGRLFDAVACALGIDAQHYEGEAACRLEALASQCAGVDHPVILEANNLALFWQQWLNWQAEPCERAWAFHDALAKGWLSSPRAMPDAYRFRQSASAAACCTTACCAHACVIISDFTLLFPSRLPAGDGAISSGRRWLPLPGHVQKGFKMLRLLRNEPRAALLLLALVMANLLAWGWAWHSLAAARR